ncbi:hypothetical protein CLAIMM_04317 [Cladophialophora immunda]|nr:hypothetical protein CLAIMM_04317 [Cladophialophora immunda]
MCRTRLLGPPRLSSLNDVAKVRLMYLSIIASLVPGLQGKSQTHQGRYEENRPGSSAENLCQEPVREEGGMAWMADRRSRPRATQGKGCRATDQVLVWICGTIMSVGSMSLDAFMSASTVLLPISESNELTKSALR